MLRQLLPPLRQARAPPSVRNVTFPARKTTPPNPLLAVRPTHLRSFASHSTSPSATLRSPAHRLSNLRNFHPFQNVSSRQIMAPNTRLFHQSARLGQAPRQRDKVKEEAKEAAASLSARLKLLVKKYGWVAAGVYLGLSLVDFPLCFVLVRVAGAERVAKVEHAIVNMISSAIPESVKELWRSPSPEEENRPEKLHSEPSLGTQLALAYALHKLLIFVRVPLTAAITPKIARVLQARGWKISRRA